MVNLNLLQIFVPLLDFAIYNLTIINFAMHLITILYSSLITECMPKVSVGTRFNGFTHTESLKTGSGKIECQLNLRPFDNLLIKFFDKVWSPSGDTHFDITTILIDGITLDHIIFDGKQYPDYSEAEFNKRSSQIYWQPGTTFHLNGVYELELSHPIWHFRIKNAR